MKSDFTVTELLSFNNDFEEVPHPDGQGLVGLKLTDGKFKSLNGDGNWEADKDSMGYYERFFPFGGGWYAYRESTRRLFVVTSRIPKIPYMV